MIRMRKSGPANFCGVSPYKSTAATINQPRVTGEALAQSRFAAKRGAVTW